MNGTLARSAKKRRCHGWSVWIDTLRHRRCAISPHIRRCPTLAASSSTASRLEELGYDSLWVWDHVLLGVEPNFPIVESLTVLTAVAARTSRIKLGTGILVLPLRNPVLLAKQLASIDQLSNGRLLMGMASGWYKREFDAMGVPFERRGKIMDANLEIMRRLWTEDKVSGEWGPHKSRRPSCTRSLCSSPDPDPHRRLCRPGAQARRDRGRRLADLFLHARSLHEILD